MDFRFDPPGCLEDFDPAGRQRWHEHMAAEAEQNVAELVSELQKVDPTATEAEAFYVNPTKNPVPATARIAAPDWGGFPLALLARASRDRDAARRQAENLGGTDFPPGSHFVTGHGAVLDLPSRHFQDEYLEWRTTRDDDEVVTRVTFTCEGYDYWSELFAWSEQTVVELYRRFLDRNDITADDLRFADDVFIRSRTGELRPYATRGDYNPRNRFNVNEGIIHLTHRANSLAAEVNLAAVASALRHDANGNVLDGSDKRRLTCCAGFGNPNRDSDPTIGTAANGLAFEGRAYTLTNPVGLYIASYPHDRVLLPGGSHAAKEWWRVVRGREATADGHARILRLIFEVPSGIQNAKGEQLRVGELEIDDEPIEQGAQLAESIRLHLMVSWWDAPDRRKLEVPCESTCCLDAENRELLVVQPEGEQCPKGRDPFPDLLPSECAARSASKAEAGPATPPRRQRRRR